MSHSKLLVTKRVGTKKEECSTFEYEDEGCIQSGTLKLEKDSKKSRRTRCKYPQISSKLEMNAFCLTAL